MSGRRCGNNGIASRKSHSWPRWCWTPANPPTATTPFSKPVCCDQPPHFFQRSTGGVIVKKRDEGHDSDHTHQEEEKCLDDQIAPRLPEGVEQCCRSPATFGEPSEEELFSFQAEHQYDGLDQGKDHNDERDQPIGNSSEACRFWNGFEHRRVTWTHTPPVCERERTRTRRPVMLAVRL